MSGKLFSEKVKDIHQDLIDRCKNNDRIAQMKLYDLYYRAVYNTILRMVKDPMEAEDLMQESFLSAFTNIDSFRSDSSFGTWIKKIAIAALFVLIPFIGPLFLAGWGLEITRRVIKEDPEPLPGWSNFGNYLVKGFQLIIIGFVYALPIILIQACTQGAYLAGADNFAGDGASYANMAAGGIGGDGGGIWCSDATILNCTIAFNVAGTGSTSSAT